MSAPESIEEFHGRVAAATDEEGRLPVAIEAMPGWDIFPFELDGLRIKPLEPLATDPDGVLRRQGHPGPWRSVRCP